MRRPMSNSSRVECPRTWVIGHEEWLCVCGRGGRAIFWCRFSSSGDYCNGRTFCCSEDFCNLTTKSGSGVAQLPHEHFTLEKSSLEVPQLDHAFMHGSQRKVQHLIMGAARVSTWVPRVSARVSGYLRDSRGPQKIEDRQPCRIFDTAPKNPASHIFCTHSQKPTPYLTYICGHTKPDRFLRAHLPWLLR